jgi:hypothetical protein
MLANVRHGDFSLTWLASASATRSAALRAPTTPASVICPRARDKCQRTSAPARADLTDSTSSGTLKICATTGLSASAVALYGLRCLPSLIRIFREALTHDVIENRR